EEAIDVASGKPLFAHVGCGSNVSFLNTSRAWGQLTIDGDASRGVISNCSQTYKRTSMKTLLKNAPLLIALALFGGCSEQSANDNAAADKDNIVIRGSNTVGEELAPRLIQDYSKSHQGMKFDTEFKGSSYGLGALMVDRCDVAATSRLVTSNDVAFANDRSIAFEDHLIGAYAVGVAVNAQNPVSNLTRQQVHDIFAGNVKNWSEVGGPDAAINIYIRNPVSGTHLGFLELALGTNAYAPNAKTFVDYKSLVEAVKNDPNGIGYSSFKTATQGGAKLVSIDNIAATEQMVQKGSYPFARNLHLYTNKNRDKKTVIDFVNYVASADGQKVLAEMDFIPHP
ncbi:MAG: pstS1, partial [Verrucomicrobiales bacterium]|nr:pstS1 [Verrucomicrobiales bacterium]